MKMSFTTHDTPLKKKLYFLHPFHTRRPVTWLWRQDLVSKSHASKADANKLFASARYSEAVSTYDHALAFVPTYLDYEVAVLRSNIAACHLKLEDWKGAADAATASLDCLARLDPATAEHKDMNKDKDSKGKTADSNSGSQNHDDDDGVVELDASDEASEASALATLAAADARRTDIQRIRAKSLLRRARARSQLGSWGDLQGSEVDYKQLLEMASGGGGVLPPSDVKEVRRMLAELPGRTAVAREREIGEMMGKLKDVSGDLVCSVFIC